MRKKSGDARVGVKKIEFFFANKRKKRKKALDKNEGRVRGKVYANVIYIF